MKKILFLSLFCLIALVSNAQRFEGGILGGFNGSQVAGDFTRGYHKPGALAGAYVQTDLSPVVYAAMEIKYSQKGSRKNPDSKKQDQTKYIMRLGYMDVPVYLGFRTSESISFLAGVSAGYLVHSSEWDNFGKFVPEDEKPFKDFDFQALLGTRYQLNNRIRFDLRFAYSFIPIRDLPVNNLWYWRDNQFNNVISTAVYYRLGK